MPRIRGADDGPQTEIDQNAAKCCVPTACHLGETVQMDDLSDCVKVICNNEQCNEGRYMHKECFEIWEDNVLTFLKSTGRARSWSEKQRRQNLWNKKGYDLAYKACGCKCGKGHLKKDLDWIAPPANNKEDRNKKKKSRKRSNDKPALIISTNVTVTNAPARPPVTQTNGNGNVNVNGNGNGVIPVSRMRTSSMSSTGSVGSGGTTPPMSGSESQSPGFTESNFASWQKFVFGSQPRRERSNSGSCIFSRRHDYSSFNNLPRHKINSYHIKMEDDVNHGNDETRCLILSILSANRVNRTSCILCHGTMIIFDRYPLIDGSFFISPRRHSKSSVAIDVDGKEKYLNAVCMGCLEGTTVSIRCKNCNTKWSGAHLILGSVYSYDIFAAVPCCADRLRCNNCTHLVIPPQTRLEYFSDYSHSMSCSHCGILDHHFVKPLQVTYNRADAD
ncbi:Headcase-like protein [Leptotrombidium deliense]|uniref:Headcase-like protein n=1 Tax=Leptotrombidium deliense TaxID=299467 RepID=A0A443SNZ1_9ACAR|nr:Headcase-like protein [Leptotrombidium deliense]